MALCQAKNSTDYRMMIAKSSNISYDKPGIRDLLVVRPTLYRLNYLAPNDGTWRAKLVALCQAKNRAGYRMIYPSHLTYHMINWGSNRDILVVSPTLYRLNYLAPNDGTWRAEVLALCQAKNSTGYRMMISKSSNISYDKPGIEPGSSSCSSNALPTELSGAQ